MFNFNHLYYFYVTARSGGVSAAARALKTSQPSLSAQLKTLEASVGKKLFLRTGRTLVLSDEGREVFGYCRRMFEIAEELNSSVRSVKPDNRRLNLGVSDELERPFVVEIVSKLARGRPAVPPLVTVTSDSHSQLLHKLKTNAVDAIITNQPAFDPTLTTLAAIEMPVVLAFRESPALRKIRWARDLADIPELRSRDFRWALPHPKLKLRSECDLFMEGKRFGGRVVFESDVLASVVRAVIDGLGVSFLPLPYIFTEVAHGKIQVRGPRRGYWSHGVWLISGRRREDDRTLGDLTTAFELTAKGTGVRRAIR
jgi:LysR family transcriptional activator of nhaA